MPRTSRTSRSNTQYQRGWYADNRDARNERRREAYASDPKVQKKNAKRAKKWRKARAAGTPVERVLYRELDGKQVRVYSTGQIADMVDVSPQTLRVWDAKGLMPECLFEGSHRVYTASQVRDIKKLAARQRR